MTRRSWRLAAPVLATVAVLSTGCTRTDDRPPQEVVLAAATATADASSARMTIRVDVPQAPGGLSGEGAFRFADRTGQLTIALPLGEGGAPVEVETRILGGTVYQRFPPHLAQFLGGTTWVKIDLAEADDLAGVDLGALAAAQSNDPAQAIAQLRGGGDDVEEVGREELRGDGVRHYRFTVDVDKAIEQAPEDQREALRAIVERSALGGVPAEAWIDDEDRLRKFVQRAEVADAGLVTTTIELFDFGVAVSVEPPPDAEVTDLGALLRGQRQN